jgi:hypothetical protein
MPKPNPPQAKILAALPFPEAHRKKRRGPSRQNQNNSGTSANATTNCTRPKILGEANIPGTAASTADLTPG